jgi:putative ABC transport system permease protein
MFPSSIALLLHLVSVLSLAWLVIVLWRRPEMLRMAVQAILRRAGFSAILLLTIEICVLSLLAMGGYFQHSFWGLSESTIRSQTGHFQIMKRGHEAHSRQDPWAWKLRDPAAITQLFRSDTFLQARVEVIAPELSFTGLLSNGKVSRTFLGRGVDPTADRKLSAFGEHIVRGERFLPGDHSVALLGTGLAQSLAAIPGSGLTILTTTPRGNMASIDLETKAVTESFSRDYDDVALKIPLAAAWEMLGDTLCDKVLVLLHDSRDLDTVLTRTRILASAQGLDLEFRRWEDLATYYQSVHSLYVGIFRFFSAILLGFVFVFVTSILEIATLQRRQEISLLRAFGVPPKALVERFLTESVLMGIFGTAFAIVLSIGLIALFNLHGLAAAPPPGSTQGYIIRLRVLEEPLFILQAGEFVLCAIVFSSLLPALRGCRRPLIESLRHG